MFIPLTKDATLEVKTRDLSRVQANDEVTSVKGVELNTGDFIIQKIAIRVLDPPSGQSKDKPRPKTAEEPESFASLDGNYDQLSDEPKAPREVRSTRFVLRTDLSDRKAKMLLDQLERQVGLVLAVLWTPATGRHQLLRRG